MEHAQPITRDPYVAGRFYPADAEELARTVARYLRTEHAPRPAAAVMVPHAGYHYSGAVAGAVFSAIEVPERVIVIAPNHSGRGRNVAVAARGVFTIPGASVPIDGELARAILDESAVAEADVEAHRFEHAIEVELPFLLARQSRLRIVPIAIGRLRQAEAIELGRALYRAARSTGGNLLVVASSDMSHYLSDDEARRVDHMALEQLLAGDPEQLYRTVVEQNISMCGIIPTTAMLAYCQDAGAQAPQLLKYATSADACGDRSRVVGYAGVVVPGTIG